MRTGLTKKIRSVLRSTPDGLTTADIYFDVLKETTSRASILTILRRMPDVYVKGWEPVADSVNFAAVWAVALPPPDAPHPYGRYSRKP